MLDKTVTIPTTTKCVEQLKLRADEFKDNAWRLREYQILTTSIEQLLAAREMAKACNKVADWFDAQASRDEQIAKTIRFVTLKEAHIADAKNYRAMAKSLRKEITAWRKAGGE